MLETKKRQNQVEMWFKASILVCSNSQYVLVETTYKLFYIQERNSTAAQDISHHYAARIANLPLQPQIHHQIPVNSQVDADFMPLSPMHHISNSDYDGRHHIPHELRYQATTAEDAAREIERSILNVETVPIGRWKAKDSNKRPASGELSGESSDLEIPKKNGARGSGHKKRKLDLDAASVADDIERSVAENSPPTSLVLKLSTSKGKGKGKQVHRELSHDSISVTPKHPRKKTAYKKKVVAGQEVDPDLLSHPPSVSGDVTPMSRPASPAQTTSTAIYELDEPIPPLKKAKKVDDSAMIKRLKVLEEAQRKVWTSIARKDVAKVFAILYVVSTH